MVDLITAALRALLSPKSLGVKHFLVNPGHARVAEYPLYRPSRFELLQAAPSVLPLFFKKNYILKSSDSN